MSRPFLRIRLRYSEKTSFDPVIWFMTSVFGPTANRDALPVKTFTFECDSTDIDLLLFRLTEAKQRLSDAIERLPLKDDEGVVKE